MTIYVLREADAPVTDEWAKRTPGVHYSPYSNPIGFVVRADSDKKARIIASRNDRYAAARWLDRALTTCSDVPETGDPGVIMGDYPTG